MNFIENNYLPGLLMSFPGMTTETRTGWGIETFFRKESRDGNTYSGTKSNLEELGVSSLVFRKLMAELKFSNLCPTAPSSCSRNGT